MILEVETPECTGHNFLVTVVGTGRVPQIKNSPRVLSIFERKCNDEHQIKLPKMLDLKLTGNSYWKFQPKMTNILFWNHFILIGHVRVKKKNSRFQNETKCKTFAKMLWKWVLLTKKIISIIKIIIIIIIIIIIVK